GRPIVHGKFLSLDGEKWWLRGVTYGTFRPGPNGELFPGHERVSDDFASMARHGVNTLRTYVPPPTWLLDLAAEHGLFVLVGLPWEQHVAFLSDRARARDIEQRIQERVSRCRSHPAVLGYTIGNEIPPSIVRWYGRHAIEQYLKRLYLAAKGADPDALVTYVNFPTTEYLELPFLDFVGFNVYLESRPRLEAYLARLHNLAGDRPLVLAEVGLDSQRNGAAHQAAVLEWQLRTIFQSGCAGAFVFAWTDEWHRGGYDVIDWDFGLTRRDRSEKPALGTVARVFKDIPCLPRWEPPLVSVVVCSYNGSRTIRGCLEGLTRLSYPNYEVIVVDDGSTDRTAAIAEEFPVRLIRTANEGLSSARNTGLKEARGEIVAYIDDDAWPDAHWLDYLVATFASGEHAGVGGPNIPPPDDPWTAACVANAPGGPIHVLTSDRVAEHIPGCNMAFRRSCLEAIGGFDVQFRKAGDDVDVCWRLQRQGWTLGFNPAAMVWHRRRGSIRAFWKQQRGYGDAEALLERKWPEKYLITGSARWEGRLYGNGLVEAVGIRRRIYHGTWGSALFQSLYEPALSIWQAIPLMPEWYLCLGLLAGLSLLGALWPPLLAAVPLLVGGTAVTVVQAIAGARRARFPRRPPSRAMEWRWRALTAALFVVQPLARLIGRQRAGLTPWRRHVAVRPIWRLRLHCRFWNEQWQEPEKMLRGVEAALRSRRAIVSRGGAFDGWDLEVRLGLFGRMRLVMGIEDHGYGKQMVLFRAWPVPELGGFAMSAVGVTLGAFAFASGAWAVGGVLAAIGLWPVLRTLYECGLATSVISEALDQLWGGLRR
ncbi:MAG TPA: glycosyltransferase, partial [Nitrospirales bacterium]|nr:glycosyltransferase [Nitrospirales bacterium]